MGLFVQTKSRVINDSRNDNTDFMVHLKTNEHETDLTNGEKKEQHLEKKKETRGIKNDLIAIQSWVVCARARVELSSADACDAVEWIFFIIAAIIDTCVWDHGCVMCMPELIWFSPSIAMHCSVALDHLLDDASILYAFHHPNENNRLQKILD